MTVLTQKRAFRHYLSLFQSHSPLFSANVYELAIQENAAWICRRCLTCKRLAYRHLRIMTTKSKTSVICFWMLRPCFVKIIHKKSVQSGNSVSVTISSKSCSFRNCQSINLDEKQYITGWTMFSTGSWHEKINLKPLNLKIGHDCVVFVRNYKHTNYETSHKNGGGVIGPTVLSRVSELRGMR